jgi:hypothetical protein
VGLLDVRTLLDGIGQVAEEFLYKRVKPEKLILLSGNGKLKPIDAASLCLQPGRVFVFRVNKGRTDS